MNEGQSRQSNGYGNLKLQNDLEEIPQQNQDRIPHQMAPSSECNLNYSRFMHFQRFHLFQSSEQQQSNLNQLGPSEIKKLFQLIRLLHDKCITKVFEINDIKGIWPVVSFIFTNRTGLFMNQFFTMITRQRLNLEIYKDLHARKQVQGLLDKVKEEGWFKDQQFKDAMQTLIKQPKNLETDEQNQVFISFTKLIITLRQEKQYIMCINNLYKSLMSPDFSKPKPQQQIEADRAEWKGIIQYSFFENNEDHYVLSEPDTLVADICDTFQASQYEWIKRKMSDELLFDDQTQTHAYQRTTARKTTQKQEKGRKILTNELFSGCKRRINFDHQRQQSRTYSVRQVEQTTIPIRSKINLRPRTQIHISNMMRNHRRVQQKNIKRMEKKQKSTQIRQTKNTQNFFLQKIIKKTFVGQLPLKKREKRNLHSHKETYSRNRQLERSQRSSKEKQFQGWEQRYVEDESVNQQISSRMQIEDDFSQSAHSKIIKRRASQGKAQRRSNNKSRSPQLAKQIKRNRQDIRKKQTSAKGLQIDQKNGEVDEKTRQKFVNKRPSSQKRSQQLRKKQSGQKENRRSKIIQSNQRPVHKKGQQFTRLRKQRVIQSDQQQNFIVEDEDLVIEYDSFIGNSETVNFQKQANLNSKNERKPMKSGNLNKYQQKYSHLLCQMYKEKQNKSEKRNQQNTLDRYLNQDLYRAQEQSQPLERMQIRELSILEFEQSEQVESRMMIIEGEQLTPYQKMRKQLYHYDYIDQTRMDFNLTEYITYLESLQTKEEVFKEIKKMTNEYLSKTFTPDFASYNHNNHATKSSTGNDSIKLVLDARKILAFSILVKKEKQLSGSHDNGEKRFASFSQTYISPMLNHYIYKILTDMYAEIINALFSSEGDEDFEMLNKASLPFMMLLYDIKQFSNEHLSNLNQDFSKSFYEEVYQVIEQQSAIFMLQLILNINEDSQLSKQVKQRIDILLLLQRQKSNINLPRFTQKFIKRGLKINLSPVNLLLASFAAYTLTSVGLYQKLTLLFTTMSIKPFDTTKLKELNNKKFSKLGNYIMIVDQIYKGIHNLNYQDKGIEKLKNLASIINKILQKVNFQFNPRDQLSLECKLTMILVKGLRQITANAGSNILIIGYDKRRSQQNIRIEETLQLIKEIFGRSINKFINNQLQKSTQIAQILNLVTIQQLNELALTSPIQDEAYILFELNLEVIAPFMSFKQFKQQVALNKGQLLSLMQKILNELKPKNQENEEKQKKQKKQKENMTFAGKNRLIQLVRKIFNILVTGYKFHLYDQGNIWRTNDEVISKEAKHFVGINDIVMNYWNLIKKIFHLIHQRCLHYKSRDQIERQIFITYSSLLHYMIQKLTEGINNKNLYHQMKAYTYCGQENCLPFSLRHVVVNLPSLLVEYKFFIDIHNDFDNRSSYTQQLFNQQLSIFFTPAKLSHNLSKVTQVQREIKLHERQNKAQDQQESGDPLLEFIFDRDTKKYEVALKLLQILSLSFGMQGNQIKQNLAKKKNASSIYGFISVIEQWKKILIANSPTSNNQNQKQKPSIFSQSLFVQFIKKYQHLSFSNNSIDNSVRKQIKEGQLQDIQSFFSFMSTLSKFIMEMFELKNKKIVKLAEQLVRRFIFEFSSSKNILVNSFTGVILKRMIYFTEVNQSILSEYSIATESKRQQQLDNFTFSMKLWCKIYEQTYHINSALIFPSTFNENEINSLLYVVFKSIAYEKKNQHNLKQTKSIFATFSDKCLEVYTNNLEVLDATKRNTYCKLMINLSETFYSYMKDLSLHLDKIKQNQQHRDSLALRKLNYPRTISTNYLNLFNTILKWPSLLNAGIQKLKSQLQSVNIEGKLLLQNLLHLNNQESRLLGEEQEMINKKDLHEALHLFEECVSSIQKLQANVYQIKQNVPNSLFILTVRKIIELQMNQASQDINKSNKLGVQHMRNSQKNLNSSSNSIKPLKNLKNYIDELSSTKSCFLLQKLLTSFIKFLNVDFQKQRNRSTGSSLFSLNGNPSQNDIAKFEIQEFRIHEMGKQKISEHRKRVFLTLLKVLEEATNQRQTVEKIFWENISHVQQFLQGQKQLNKEETECKSVQEIILKCMIGLDSDFYLIKLMLNSRIQKLLDLPLQSQQDLSQIGIKFRFIQRSMQKAIEWASRINSSQQIDAKVQMRCNVDLEQWFRQKNRLISKIVQLIKSKVRPSHVEGSLATPISIRDMLKQNNVIIGDSGEQIHQEGNDMRFLTKMEIEE